MHTGLEEILNRLEKVEQKVNHISEVLRLWSEVSFPGGMIHPVELLLRQRGRNVISANDHSFVILPLAKDPQIRRSYYRYLSRYSFRLFMKDLINKKEGNDWRTISRYCSIRTSKTYMAFLEKAGLIECSEKDFSYRYAGKPTRSFGPTLEWYVSEVMQREFMAPSLFGVKLANTLYGGDYDVISILQGFVVYVEVKSSPPRGVEKPAVEAFMRRLEDLVPDIAIFMVDTELRMKDKIAILFEEVTGKKVDRLVRELFYLNNCLYIINTRKGIGSNLNRCFRNFFRTIGGFNENLGKRCILSLGESGGKQL